MLPRYTLPEMEALWSDKAKFARWLQVELEVLKARAGLHELPWEVWETTRSHAQADPERIAELEAEFEHDMVAFVTAVKESLERAGVGERARHFHNGLTSYDIEDPALILTLREAVRLVVRELDHFAHALTEKAREHQWTMVVARTHGQPAAPTTFGQILLVSAEQVQRSIGRLNEAIRTELGFGKLSGAVGIFGTTTPLLEMRTLEGLGLEPARAETQILQRDRHAIVMSILAVAACSIEQMCRTFWELMRGEVRELAEARTPRQRGSSAMPHKRNPIVTERLMGLSRMVRACQGAALENIATPEWRDISQSSVERHIFPIATGLVHYMAVQATALVRGLQVFPERMLRYLSVTSYGVWAGQAVWLRLMEAGLESGIAYVYVQQAADDAVAGERHLRDVLSERPISDGDLRTAAQIIGHDELERCFDARAQIEQSVRHLFGG
ncbi:adenylosuccinate lyase [Candidatus Parcubacteria bacterium]|nr:adenylosuccinate lyase [Candidatus Parcubacteria bacterium]